MKIFQTFATFIVIASTASCALQTYEESEATSDSFRECIIGEVLVDPYCSFEELECNWGETEGIVDGCSACVALEDCPPQQIDCTEGVEIDENQRCSSVDIESCGEGRSIGVVDGCPACVDAVTCLPQVEIDCTEGVEIDENQRCSSVDIESCGEGRSIGVVDGCPACVDAVTCLP